jgi:replicative DNA helicase
MSEPAPAVLEATLLSSLRTPGDVRLCKELGISADSFDAVPELHAKVWTYLDDYLRRQDEPPKVEDLRQLFGFEVTEPGDLEEYARRVREREVYRLAKSAVWRRGADLEVKPTEAIAGLIEDLSALHIDGGRRRQHFLDSGAKERLDRFDEAQRVRARGGFIGIPTGLEYFDCQNMGFVGGDVVIVFGTLGVGKSWLLMHMAVTAWNAGKRVLMISPEMTIAEQGLRFDVMGAHLKHIELSHRKLRHGEETRERYMAWLHYCAQGENFVILDAPSARRPFTFDDVWALTAEYKPDEVVIDGLHLLGIKGAGKAGWEVLKEGVEMLKALAQHDNIPVLAVHQATREAGKDESTPPGIAQIGYGYSIAQVADYVFALSHSKPYDSGHRSYLTRKVRDDERSIRRHELLWDVDRGHIEELAMITHETDEALPPKGPAY